MLALARSVSCTLSGQRCRSFSLSLALVMPRAQPLEIRRSVVITWLDVVALSTSCRAARPVMQERFAPAACAGADEGAALVPVRREPRCAIAR